MTLRFIHSSDWQIGKVFRFVDEQVMALLQEARLAAITRLGELANEHGASHVLVAGDVYDMEAPSPRLLNRPLERMRNFGAIFWHLLPGNHDPQRPGGLWEQLLRKGVPSNVRIHHAPGPVMTDGGAMVLLPAPLHHRRTLTDPTAYMDGVTLPEGIPRIGLAHGSVTGFGSSQDQPNYIAPDRPERAGLAYLALGDWHGQKKISDRCWYSGTPETDAFDVSGGGKALLVEIEGPRAPPKVTPLETGSYTWITLRENINSQADIGVLQDKLRSLGTDLSRILVDLTVEGALSLESRAYFEDQIRDTVSAAFCILRIDDAQLFPNPTIEDLDQIDSRLGFVRRAAEELQRRSVEGREGERELAAEALQRLYVEHRKLQGGQQ
jgi:DNA repair exonuclease SbcCD nuclease subunit